MKHVTCRGIVAGLLAVVLLPIFAACGNATPSTTGGTTATNAPSEPAAPAASAAPAEAAPESNAPRPEGKVLRVHEISTPDVVDPQKSSFSNEIVLLSMAYEGLTRLDKELKAAPAAAESWTFNDDLTKITYKLHPDMKYSDGSPLTSENFRYVVERTCDPKTAGEYQSFLFDIIGCQEFATSLVTDTAAYEAARAGLSKGVETPDANTISFNLTQPAPYFPYITTLWTFYPAKKELIESGGEAWWKKAENQVGNGPFAMVSYNEGQLASFKANPNYWAGRPKLDGIEFIYQGDTSIAQQAYLAGQLDIAQVDPSQIPQIKADPVLSKELHQYPAGATAAWGFNLTKAPFEDKKVREAFAYAIDRKTFCEVVRNGDCLATQSWIPQGIPGSIKTDAYAYDPAKAKQALAESSYGNADKLPEIKLSYNNDDPAATPRLEWIAGQLRDNLGINAVLDPVEGATLAAMRKDPATYPQACVFCNNWSQDYPDPQNWLSGYWKCDATFAKRVSYCDSKLDDLISKADVEPDPAKRTALYEQAGQILIDDLPAPFVFNPANVYLVKSTLSGYDETVSDSEFPGQWTSLLTMDIGT